MSNVLYIIPARAGSKGVPGKNRKLLGGKPLFEHAVDLAIQVEKSHSGVIVLSTDDDDIINSQIEYSNFIVDRRPQRLSSDSSKITDTINYVINKYNLLDLHYICLLQVTSPLRSVLDVSSCIETLVRDSLSNTVISVVNAQEFTPGRIYKIENGSLQSLNVGLQDSQRQENDYFFRNGCIYVTRMKSFIQSRIMFNEPIKPYIMDSDDLLNIDSNRDILVMDKIYENWKKKSF